jgi:hypothetical protein
MADTETDIANDALQHLGSASFIQNLETDTSKDARVMRRLYHKYRRSLLSIWEWPFATIYQKGVIVKFWPTPEYGFAYQYPNNCLKMSRIWNFRHTDDIETKIESVQSNDGAQRLIYSNFGPPALLPQNRWIPTTTPASTTGDPYPVAVFQFVADCENVGLFPELFKDALSLMMAGYAAPSLPGIGTVDFRKQNLELGAQALSLAGAQNMNEIFITPEKRSLIERAATGTGIVGHVSGFNHAVPQNWNP